MEEVKLSRYKKRPDGKNNTGRPSKYDPKYNEIMMNYFSREPNKGVLLPTAIDFYRKNNIPKSTFYDRIEKEKEFSATFEQCKELQKNFLNQMALLGYYNGLYSKFLAINITDMVDKKEVDTKHSGSIATANIELNEDQKRLIAQQILNAS